MLAQLANVELFDLADVRHTVLNENRCEGIDDNPDVLRSFRFPRPFTGDQRLALFRELRYRQRLPLWAV